ncbi:MAG: hypothetical protein EAZ97_06630 [Bacteroidetes bacterium]|nr:MAG: hypothetical protein EAZ97_06630 [Bacteroidota bacterium]
MKKIAYCLLISLFCGAWSCSKSKKEKAISSLVQINDSLPSVTVKLRELHNSGSGSSFLPDTSAYVKKVREYNRINDIFLDSLDGYIRDHKKYPEEAKKLKKQGSVLIKFRINKDSTVDVWILDGLKYGCDVEAERVLREAIKANLDKAQHLVKDGTGQIAFRIFFVLE